MAFSEPVSLALSSSSEVDESHPEQDICRRCNHLQFSTEYGRLYARDTRNGRRTEISGTRFKYTISLHTYRLLAAVPDPNAKRPEHNRRPQDCRYCALLYDALSLFFAGFSWDWTYDSARNSDIMLHIDVERGQPMMLRVNESFHSWNSIITPRAIIEISCADRGDLEDSDLPRMDPPPPYPANTSGDEACEKAFCRVWDKCSANTGFANQGYFFYVPNRILYVDGFSHEVVLWEKWSELPGLIEIGQRVDYATLCHSWVPADPRLPKLLHANINDWRRGVSFIYLPPAIMDAVRVCIINKIPFLWVDSLCIIQDDAVDIKRQLSVAGQYFRDSLLTIVAASASSPDDHFLSPPPQNCITKEMKFEAPSGATVTLTLRRKYFRPMSFSGPADSASAKLHHVRSSFRRPGKLYSRDWNYQRLMLATRALNFTPVGVLYECKHHNCAQEPLNRRRRIDMFAAAPDPIMTSKANASWLKAMGEYTSLVSTRGNDRLTAVAGLAACSELAMRDIYAAGHWESGLPMSLLWHGKPCPGQKAVSRIKFKPNETRPPSFSWASSASAAVWEYRYDHHFRPIASVVELSPTPDNYNPYRAFPGAFIRLKGPLKPCKVGQILTRNGKFRRNLAHIRDDTPGAAKTITVDFHADGPLNKPKDTNRVQDIVRRNRLLRDNLRRWLRNRSDVPRAQDSCPQCKTHTRAQDSYPQCKIAIRTRDSRTQSNTTTRAQEYRTQRKILQVRNSPTTQAFILAIGTQGRKPLSSLPMRYDTVDGLVLVRSINRPNTFKRIGCIRKLPLNIFKPLEHQEITLM